MFFVLTTRFVAIEHSGGPLEDALVKCALLLYKGNIPDRQVLYTMAADKDRVKQPPKWKLMGMYRYIMSKELL